MKNLQSNLDSSIEEIKPLRNEYSVAEINSPSNDNNTSVANSSENYSTATINVNYYGFSAKAQNAFEYAVNIWEGWIDSDIVIEVDAYWEDLSEYGSDVLGAASPYSFRRNFTDEAEDDTWYPISLANHLAGDDLNGDNAEIEVWLNSDFSNWYFGTDGDTPNGQYDVSSIVLHELAHGLGITDWSYYSGGTGWYGDTIYESFIVNGDDEKLSDFPDNSEELGDEFTSNDLYFNGDNAKEANGGEKVKLYAPSTWQDGSSLAHLDENTYPRGDENSLMTPFFSAGEVVHDPGAITLGILEDLGWDINDGYTESVVEIPAEAPIQTPEETPSTPVSNIIFSSEKITSYHNQDKSSTLNIAENQQGIEINGNGWKKFDFNYEVTEKTILTFEFFSDKEGEIQGIGFETNNTLTDSEDKPNFFQLLGTDENWGITDFGYQTNSGWQSYTINVGEHFTGDFNYLLFANDHDNGTKDASSQYRNLKIYEQGEQPIPVETPPEEPTQTPEETPSILVTNIIFSSENITSYHNQDKNSTLTIADNQQGIEINGNGWKKFDFKYEVTEKTVLTFDFFSDKEGEIQGIGFETNNTLTDSEDKPHFFQLLGTDENWGITDFEYQINSGWQSYTINVGEHFTGDFNYLLFANDHDNGTKDASSQYRNLKIYEQGEQPIPVETPPEEPTQTPEETPSIPVSNIIFSSDNITSYHNQDKNSTLTIADNQQGIEINGNGWKKFDFKYEVTEKTVLTFDFFSDKEGEIQGIGFETNNTLTDSEDKPHFFQLLGTDENWGITDFEYQTNSGWQSYTINVGEHFTGDFNYLLFANDHDNGTKDARSQYRNLKIYEQGEQPISVETPQEEPTQTPEETPSIPVSNIIFSSDNITSYHNQDKNSTLTIADNQQGIEINGNGWKKFDFDYEVTEKTVLTFEFFSDKEGEIQGIGFETNNTLKDSEDKPHFFQLLGTDENWGITDFEYQINSGWQSYTINVGEHFTGDFNYLLFANDHDNGTKDAHSQFRNISLFEM